MKYHVYLGDQVLTVDVSRKNDHTFEAVIDGRMVSLDVSSINGKTLSMIVGDESRLFVLQPGEGDRMKVASGGDVWDLDVKTGSASAAYAARQSAKKGRVPILSPMPGKVLRILPKEGQPVKAGDCVAIIEAMKMENELKCPKDGQVVKLEAREGDTVDSGDAIMIVDDVA